MKDNNGKNRLLYWLVFIFLVGSCSLTANSRLVLLHVDEAPLAWGDSQLTDKLMIRLSRLDNLQVQAVNEPSPHQPAFPREWTNNDSLLNWGMELGGRYLMVIKVQQERLENRKGFSLPLVFHKYETVGIVSGEIRFLDLSRGKLLMAEPFKIELKGPRIIQGSFDDNENDPDIHIKASKKTIFFSQLEDKAAEELVRKITRLTGGR